MSKLEQKAWDKGYACGKLDTTARIEQLEARLDRAVTRELDQMERIATLEQALVEQSRRINDMRAALRKIKDFPYIGEKAAQQMALIASTAVAQSCQPKVLLPCPVCGGEAIHAVDTLKRTVIQPARQENDDVFKGFRGNNEA